MPRMTRVRLASLGPVKARVDDLTLPLTNADDRATDSVIWLRNAGGKSTILALLLALIEPDQRHFLGVRSDHKQRSLEDYIAKDDRALVVAEWEADTEGQMDIGQPPRFLTGVLMERHYGGNGGKPNIRRLFFNGKVLPGVQELTLDGLPYYVTQDDALHRRGRASFRSEWNRLRQEHPTAELFATDNQGDWKESLANLGIDSDLFRYQVRMNEKEGGADTVFQFTNVDDFVRMFLDMVLRPSAGTEANTNLSMYREKLVKRAREYQPEADLIEGLLVRMGPVLQVTGDREALGERLDMAAREARGLGEHIGHALSRVDLELTQSSEQIAEHKRLEAHARRAARDQWQDVMRAETWRLDREIQALDAEIENSAKAHRNAERDVRIWEAAAPLADAKAHRMEADGYRSQIEERMEEHRPLRERLAHAARRFAAALAAARIALGEEAETREATVARLNEEITRTREMQAVSLRDAGIAQQRAAQAESDREKAERARLGLEGDGVIDPHQDVDERLGELAARAGEIGRERQGATSRQQAIAEERKQIARELQSLTDKKTRAQVQRDQAEAELEVADTEKREIESSPLLVQYLGVADVDLEQLSTQAPEQLLDQAARMERESTLLHVAQARDQRAIHSLESTDLLPPSPDVEAVLDALQGKVQAWAGWHYIARNLPDATTRRALVRRHPELATGVVVRDDQMERTRDILAAAAPHVEEAVTVVGASLVLDAEAAERLVVGPTPNARLDHEAGRDERVRRRRAYEERESEIERARLERISIEELAQRLRDFQRRHGEGWFGAQRSRVRDLLEREAALDRQIGTRSADDERLLTEATALDTRIGEMDDEARKLERFRSRLDAFRAHHPGGVEAYQRVIEQAAQEEAAASERAREAHRALTSLDEEKRSNEEERQAVLARSSELGRELAGIVELEGEQPSPEPGDLETLRASYTSLAQEWKGNIDDAGLEARLDAALRQEERFRARFRARCQKSSLDPSEVERQLVALPAGSDLDELKARATSRAEAARDAIGARTRARDDARKAQETVRKRASEMGVSRRYDRKEHEPRSIEEAHEREERGRTLAAEQEASATEYAGFLDLFEKEASALTNRQHMLRQVEDRIRTTVESHAILPTRVSMDGWSAPASDEELDRRASRLRDDLSRAARADKELDSQAESAFQDVQGFVTGDDFRELKLPILQSLYRHSARTLEEGARDLVEQLEQRLQHLRHEIEHIERDRDDVVAAVLKEAEEALIMLGSLERHSRLPDDLPYQALAGQHVLRITTGQPRSIDGRKQRVADFLDNMIGTDRTYTSSALVIEAALHLGHGIRVSILSPDPVRRDRRPITDLAVMSGGERMTCATMLYCALARLRARNRGQQGRQKSSTLLLDNPVGTASWRSLVDLQRAMARSMNIQLIYLTGVRDYEAISAMTNKVRLRNGRIDVRTGEQIVEFEGRIEGPAQLSRVAESTGA